MQEVDAAVCTVSAREGLRCAAGQWHWAVALYGSDVGMCVCVRALTVMDYCGQVLLLKSYLQSKGLKDVYTGGLGSFSLTIMLVFYLEVWHEHCTQLVEWKLRYCWIGMGGLAGRGGVECVQLVCVVAF